MRTATKVEWELVSDGFWRVKGDTRFDVVYQHGDREWVAIDGIVPGSYRGDLQGCKEFCENRIGSA